MHVSPSIIRFPTPALTAVREAGSASPQDNVVNFPRGEENETDSVGAGFRLQLQEFGQLFAAHRIVGRIADDLEAVAAL